MTKVLDVKGLLAATAETTDAERTTADDIRRLGDKFRVGVPSWALSSSAPVKRQYLPNIRELRTTAAERADPIGDHRHKKCEGLIHRYRDRALLMPTHNCAVYCRFCFRRHEVGKAAAMSEAELDRAFAYLAANEQIKEVILTGGDPLLLGARPLEAIIRRLELIKHIQVLRIHSRLPVAVPDALTAAKLRVLGRCPLPLYVVIHCNHGDELTAAALAALAALRRSGAVLLAQTVLLKGVNDELAALEGLFRLLVRNRVLPYYLHHPDLAEGTSHFRLGIKRGRQLAAELRRRVSGLCRPQYVLDIPGGFGKVPISPSHIRRRKNGWLLTDLDGETHFYGESAADNSPSRR